MRAVGVERRSGVGVVGGAGESGGIIAGVRVGGVIEASSEKAAEWLWAGGKPGDEGAE